MLYKDLTLSVSLTSSALVPEGGGMIGTRIMPIAAKPTTNSFALKSLTKSMTEIDRNYTFRPASYNAKIDTTNEPHGNRNVRSTTGVNWSNLTRNLILNSKLSETGSPECRRYIHCWRQMSPQEMYEHKTNCGG